MALREKNISAPQSPRDAFASRILGLSLGASQTPGWMEPQNDRGDPKKDEEEIAKEMKN